MAEQAGLKKKMSTQKGLLTRKGSTVERRIAEGDVEDVNVLRTELMALFRKFHDAHESYHDTITDESQVESSLDYYDDVQKTYTGHLHEINEFRDKIKSTESDVAADKHNDLANSMAQMMNLPPLELKNYDGSVQEYDTFIMTFKSIIEHAVPASPSRLIRLKSLLTGAAADAVRSCRAQDDDGYSSALKILEERFGSSYSICTAIISSLTDGKNVRSPTEIRLFADELANAEVTLKGHDMLAEIDTQRSIVKMCQRLQPHLRIKWRDQVMKEKKKTSKYLNFSRFVTFIKDQADVVNDPIYGQSILYDNSHSNQAQRSKKSVVGMSMSAQSKEHEDTSPAPHHTLTCCLCGEDHRLYYCQKFNDMPVDQRIAHVKSQGLCPNCFRKGHRATHCRSPYVCRIDGCNQKHSKLMHIPRPSSDTTQVSSNSCAKNSRDRDIYMPIVPVIINKSFHTYALLDTGSSSSFCTRRLKDGLKLDSTQTTFELRTLHGSTSRHAEAVNIRMTSQNGTETLSMNNVLVTDDIPVVASKINVSKYKHLRDLHFNVSNHVDILIGQDYPAALAPLEIRKGAPGTPFATRTIFGWSLNGHSTSSIAVVGNKVAAHFISTSPLEHKVNQLWQLEEEGTSSSTICNSREDELVMALWDRECKINDGKYELPIPWKHPELILPNNYEAAKSRLSSLRKSLQKRGLTETYDEGIRKMLSKGYAEPVRDEQTDVSPRCWYLPTHSVSKKEPGKIRIVYDCASIYKGVSLNNSCLQGPNMTSQMFHVLIRFRQYKYAVMADIREMYNQIKIPDADRDALRFLWYVDGRIRIYRSTCHLFGGVWCSSSSSYALRRTANCTHNQKVKDAIHRSFYVDDLAYSTPSVREAHDVLTELKSILSSRGFHLTKFVSTHPALLSPIDASDQVGEPNMMTSCTTDKALGVGWNRIDDVFFAHTQVKLARNKSDMLSVLASVFDPLGLVSPLLIQGKILFQDACRMKLDWQAHLPDTLIEEWNGWTSGLHDVHKLVIPRCLIPSTYEDASYELHAFCDASSVAYGCCIYIRCTNKTGDIQTSLICSKSRICPMKSITIPRLELQAAVLATKLESSVRAALDVQLLPTTFWSDSMIVIAYIKNESRRFQVFISNRINTIRSTTDKKSWHHIPGDQNPADLLTRPTTIKRLNQLVWVHGPAFLQTHKSEWAHLSQLEPVVPEGDPECKKITKCSLACINTTPPAPLDALISHYSDWTRLKRAVAWLIKILHQLQHKRRSDDRAVLDADDIKASQIIIIKHVQAQHFSKEISVLHQGCQVSCSSALRKLNPTVDNDGCLVVGGRLRYSNLEQSAKTPYILPYGNPVSTIIVRSIHDRCHLGREWIHSLVRKQFWIIRARNIIYQVSKNCVICKKLFANPGSQMMANLPPLRVQHNGRAFSHVGLDVFGPFIVKRGRHELKRYGCVFTCFNIRAIHIEMLDNLESDTFLNALRRFIARRGTPDTLFSDNATNFTGARAELFRSLNETHSKPQQYCIHHDITWNLNTPTASHMGGVYERMIRTIRKVLTGLLIESQRLTEDVLRTFFCEAESIINTRPLTKMSDDINDATALTPGHFLLIDVKPNGSTGHFSAGDMYRRRWRHTQYLCELFWRRYVNSYLPELQRRHKWLQRKPNKKIGDLVLILDENTPRRLWPMGLITEVIEGRDGMVRSVRIRTQSKEFVRPITKVIDLELETVQ